jgi:ABC-type polysaccharide/polyol phosphate export permease
MAAVLALLRRDWKTARTQRFPIVLDILAVVFAPAVLFYVSRFVRHGPGSPPLFAFSVAGIAVLRVHAAILPILQRLQVDLASGSFAILVGSPVSLSGLLSGLTAFQMVRGALTALCTLLVAAAIYGAAPHVTATYVAAVLVATAGAMVLFASLAIVIVGAMLVSRAAVALASVAGVALPVVMGSYFPVGTLPEPLRQLALAMPFHLPVDLLREGVLHDRFELSTGIELLAGATVALGIALLVGSAGIGWARRAGTLGTE